MSHVPIRVAVADDHPVVRDGMRLLFASRDDVEIVGEAATGDAIVSVASETIPDVVIMDLQMPGLSGIEATRQIVNAHPSIGVLVLTMYDDDNTVFAALRAGAKGYLLKGAEQNEIVRAVTAVASGEAIFGPAIATRIASYFDAPPQGPQQAFPELTDRELDILDLVATGQNNALIARHLGLSSKTIANHVSNILSKLQLADRAAAIIRARDAGLGTG